MSRLAGTFIHLAFPLYTSSPTYFLLEAYKNLNAVPCVKHITEG